ncbi:insulinase family protein, partial [Sphingomonas bacterium]|uniref:insulinase family protein n=1 Tax=Sphingomonas bacterium TaxID=1895847 RepID=UPI001575A0A6
VSVRRPVTRLAWAALAGGVLAATAAVPSGFPAHNDAPVIRRHDGPANQAAAIIAWPTGSGAAEIRDARQLDVLAQIFTDRLFDKLRNAAGASYSPSVASQWPVGGGGIGRFIAIGQVPPDKTAFFFTLARSIAADLIANPVGDDELKRLLGPMKEQFLRASTGNLFWLRQLGGASFDPARFAATRSLPDDLFGTTPASLQVVAAKYLQPGRDWTMAVAPKAVAP